LRKLRAIAFDVGDQDRGVSIQAIARLDAALTEAMIRHTFEQYSGTHVSRIPERLETKLLPFFLERLNTPASKPVSRGR